MPELPTIAEQGFPSIVAENWCGIYAPAGTPKAIISTLNTEIVKVLRNQEVVKERLQALGTEVVGSTPEEFAEYIPIEMESAFAEEDSPRKISSELFHEHNTRRIRWLTRT